MNCFHSFKTWLTLGALLLLCCLVTAGCGSTGKQQTPTASETQTSAISKPQITTIGAPQTPTNELGWIAFTAPYNGETDVPLNPDIVITFAQDMDAKTLNWKNISIYELIHDGLLNDMFNYHYDSKTRRLLFKLKEPDYDLGPGNSIVVIISGNIANSKGQKMNKEYTFNFGVSTDYSKRIK